MSAYVFNPETREMEPRNSGDMRSITVQDVYGSEADLDNLSEQSDEAAMKQSTVWACVKVIAESCSSLPLHVYKREDGAIRRQSDHYLDGFLRDAPHPELTWQSLRTAFMTQLVLRGNGYTWNKWQRGRIQEMEPLLSGYVLPERRTNGRVVYQFATDYDGRGYQKLKPEISHFVGMTFDGVCGLSPISSYAMAAAKAQQKHGVAVFEKGARLTGILSVGMRAYRNEDMRKQMRAEWEQQMKVARTGTGTAILLEGTEYNPISMSLADAQFIESQKFSVEEIARIFRVPMHKINALDRATFSNIEQLSREFYTDTLLPWLTFVEAAMNATWLTSAERRAGYCLKHDASEILKGDTEQRSKAAEKFVLGGIMTQNEARLGESLPPIDGGDELVLPLNHATVAERAANLENSKTETKSKEGKPDDNRSADVSALTPIIEDALRALHERESKALDRARGKEDEGDRVEKFLTDHRRAVSQRFAPIAESLRGLGKTLDVDQLAELFVEHSSQRATGKRTLPLKSADILERL